LVIVAPDVPVRQTLLNILVVTNEKILPPQRDNDPVRRRLLGVYVNAGGMRKD
jgi:hypothetical protein